jgi:hypothetical protein
MHAYILGDARSPEMIFGVIFAESEAVNIAYTEDNETTESP